MTRQIANSFGRPLSQVSVCTIFSLLKPPTTVLISFVSGNLLPTLQYSVYKLLHQLLFIYIRITL